MRVGIVGHEEVKFSAWARTQARDIIRGIIADAGRGAVVVSGHCHLGGVDMWAEEIGRELGASLDIKAPAVLRWEARSGEPPFYGFKARNLDIARDSDIVHVVAVREYAPGYTGRREPFCYHCARAGRTSTDHKKGGGCWTAIEAMRMGKRAEWHVVGGEPTAEASAALSQEPSNTGTPYP